MQFYCYYVIVISIYIFINFHLYIANWVPKSNAVFTKSSPAQLGVYSSEGGYASRKYNL